MVSVNAYNTYRNSQVYEGMDPKELILVLYNEALRRLVLTREGVLEKNSCKRGENLGRAIAIISELNSCLENKSDAEEIGFLQGLYRAMLLELPKVNITNDVKILDRSYGYIARLKEIWETQVMGRKAAREQSAGQQAREVHNQYGGNVKLSGASISV